MPNEQVGQTNFHGASGTSYEFSIYKPDADIPSVGGVFVVSGISRDASESDERRIWLVGRSRDMSRTANQVARHARLDGVEHQLICIHVEDQDRQTRDRIARDLAAAYRPEILLGI